MNIFTVHQLTVYAGWARVCVFVQECWGLPETRPLFSVASDRLAAMLRELPVPLALRAIFALRTRMHRHALATLAPTPLL